MNSRDPRIGAALANHGTAQDAIDFVLDGRTLSMGDAEFFLRNWREGDLDEWPEFYGWLALKRTQS